MTGNGSIPAELPLLKRPDPEEYELYDLKTDPGEQTNIAEKNEKRCEEFFKIYQSL